MRLFLCASMDKLPNDPLLLDLSSEEIAVMYHHKKKYMRDLQTALGTMLGTHWTSESVHAEPIQSKRLEDTLEAFDTPLALLLQPKLGKWLREHTPKPKAMRLRTGEFEFEELHGKNLIREHQRKLLKEASKILEA